MMIELQIDAELQAWIDPLSSDESALLEESIVSDGCRDPLVVWGGYLLDGHNRYAICRKHGIEFSTYEKAGLSTKVDVKIWMIENQLGKRNTTDFGRAALALKLKPLLESQAAERMLAGKADPVQNSAQGTGKTRDAVAKAAGVSHDTVRKVEKIIEKATSEVIEQVRTGAISINAAAKTVATPKAVREEVQPTFETREEANSDDFGPSDAEVADALAAEAEQLEYIQNLLANVDDPLAQALADVSQLRQLNGALKSQNDGYQATIAEQIRIIKGLRSKLAKLERAA